MSIANYTDRERALLADCERLTAELDNIKQVEFPKRLRNVTKPIIAQRDALRAKLAALEKEAIDSAKMTLLLTEELQYIAGIADKGRGQSTIQDNLTVRSVILGYVKDLEDKLAAAGAAPVPEDWRSAVAMAYGHLWHINNEPMAPIPLRSEESASYAARKLLRDLLTTEERGEAINAVQKLLSAAPKEPT